MDYVIELMNCHVSLRFNPILQRLSSIRFSSMQHVELCYPNLHHVNNYFSHPLRIARLIDIYTVFGPTSLGHFENEFQHYILEYPGLVFVFNIPQEQTDYFINHPIPSDHELPNQLYTIPLIRLYCRHADPDAHICTPPQAMVALQKENNVQVMMGEGISLRYPSLSYSSTIIFGTHVQDVIHAIGLPQKRFQKPKSLLTSSSETSYASSSSSSHIHHLHNTYQHPALIATHPSTSTLLDEPDYFFNYFNLGMDILFDGKLHVVKKIILWTNLPGQIDFGTYSKCHFSIDVNPAINMKRDNIDQSHPQEQALNNDDDFYPSLSSSSPHSSVMSILDHHQQHTITPQSSWSTIETLLGVPKEDPHWYPTQEGVFGGMTYYAYPNLIFEVMQKTQYVSKIFLFPKTSS